MISARLPSGREVLLSADQDESGSEVNPSEYEDVAFGIEFQDVVDTAVEIGGLVSAGLHKIRPRAAKMELTIGVDAKTGKLTAMFVEGSANGALKISLEWGRPDEADEGRESRALESLE